MQVDDIAQLRLFALEHASEGACAQARRYKSMPHMLWTLTLEQVEQHTHSSIKEGMTPIHALSHQLLKLTYLHPEGIAYGENRHLWTDSVVEQARVATDRAHEMQSQTESRMLEVARKLCKLANQQEPEWLKALTVSQHQPAAKKSQDRPAGKTGTPPLRSWQEAAREIADELDMRDEALGTYCALKGGRNGQGMGDRVAAIMRERRIAGPHGPVSGNTVVREALQGGRWRRPRNKKRAGEMGEMGEP